MQLLEFTADDLALNRAGQLSPHQLADLTRGAVGAGALFAMVLGVALMVLFGVRPRRWARLFYAVMFATNVTIFGVFAWNHIAARVDRRVVVVQGPIEIAGGMRQSSVLVVAGQSYSISVEAGQALRRGDEYRVYGLAHSSTFLSLEPSPRPETGHAQH